MFGDVCGDMNALPQTRANLVRVSGNVVRTESPDFPQFTTVTSRFVLPLSAECRNFAIASCSDFSRISGAAGQD
jgi:hypothetical protein